MKKIFYLFFIMLMCYKLEAQIEHFTNLDTLLLQGKYQKALKILENEPISFDVFVKSAEIYKRIGDYSKAVNFYKKALEIKDENLVKVSLGNVSNLAGYKTEAVTVYEKIIQKDSTNLLVLNSLGKIYLSEFKPKRAEKIYRYLTKQDTLNPSYPFQLAKAFSKQNKFFKMGQSYLEAYKLDTMHLRSIYELAKFFKKLRYKDSTNLFIDKGLVIDSLSINFNLLKAQELYFTRQFKSAIKIIDRLASLNYKSVTLYEMKGMCYYNLKDYDAAEKAFREGLKMDFSNSQLHYRLASLYYDQKKLKLAEMSDFMSIFNATPKLDKQYFLLGLIAHDKNDLKNAIKHFKKAFASNTNNYKSLFQLALTTDAYYKDKKKGLALYQKYLYRFETKNKENTLFAKSRIKAIKKALFLKGERVN
ncbi:MAG: tetratricopeptide repeat protein [Flavobacteriaceae bacterium]